MTDPPPAITPNARPIGLRELVNAKTFVDPSREVNRRQWEAVGQCLRKKLRGHETHALDFHCGSGPFTAELAALIDGEVLGVDTRHSLLREATPAPGVRFVHTPDGRVPVGGRSMDVVLVNRALSGLRGRLLDRAVAEVHRVLKNGGLLVVVENTADRPDTEHHVYRAPQDYLEMFPDVALRSMNKPGSARPRLSVLMGRMMGA